MKVYQTFIAVILCSSVHDEQTGCWTLVAVILVKTIFCSTEWNIDVFYFYLFLFW